MDAKQNMVSKGVTFSLDSVFLTFFLVTKWPWVPDGQINYDLMYHLDDNEKRKLYSHFCIRCSYAYKTGSTLSDTFSLMRHSPAGCLNHHTHLAVLTCQYDWISNCILVHGLQVSGLARLRLWFKYHVESVGTRSYVICWRTRTHTTPHRQSATSCLHKSVHGEWGTLLKSRTWIKTTRVTCRHKPVPTPSSPSSHTIKSVRDARKYSRFMLCLFAKMARFKIPAR